MTLIHHDSQAYAGPPVQPCCGKRYPLPWQHAVIEPRTQLERDLAWKERTRERLIAQEKARLGTGRLLDSDYDRIAGQVAFLFERRVAKRGAR